MNGFVPQSQIHPLTGFFGVPYSTQNNDYNFLCLIKNIFMLNMFGCVTTHGQSVTGIVRNKAFNRKFDKIRKICLALMF